MMQEEAITTAVFFCPRGVTLLRRNQDPAYRQRYREEVMRTLLHNSDVKLPKT